MKNHLLIIIIFLNFIAHLGSISKAEVSNLADKQEASKFLAFNWGSSMGVDLALTSAESDSIQTEKGYLIGPVFWKSLMISQSDADHKAGDGVYFSTHPLNSSRFGPSLLLLEVEIENINDKSLFDVLSENQARAHPKDLPTIVKYQGNWHVIKSLPRSDKVKI